MKNENNNKKKNNKGFSLVELIVVIAIMAVLMVVLAPAMLRYVEKSRVQKDDTAVHEVQRAVELALADETVASNIPAAGTSVTVRDGVITGSVTQLISEVEKTTKSADVKISSKTYNGKAYTITVTAAASGSDGFTVSGAWN